MKRACAFLLADGAALALFALKLRENEVKRRAFAGFAVRFDAAGVFLHDAVGNRQTESCAAADTFRREKRIVDFAQVFRGDAFARVGDFDDDIAVFVKFRQQSNLSAAEHRITRVKNQIRENLL